MKKMLLTFALMLQSLMSAQEASTEFYMGEMKCHYANEQYPAPFGLFFLKRVYSPEDQSIQDTCFLTSTEEGNFHFEHISFLQEDPNEFIASNPDADFVAEGEMIGFPWKWSELHEHLEFEKNGGVIIDIQNKRLENGTIISLAHLFFDEEGDGQRHFFATFSAHLYPVDPEIVKAFILDD